MIALIALDTVAILWIAVAAALAVGAFVGWLVSESVRDEERVRVDRLRSTLTIIETLDDGPASAAARNALEHDRRHG